MTLSPQQRTPSRTQRDLRERWEDLMGDGGFGRRSLWLMFLDDEGQQADLLVPIDDVPMLPDPREVRAIGELVGRIRDELSAAEAPMLISRPGPAELTEGDRRWAVALTDAVRDLHPRWPIHLATRNRVQVFTPNDLLGARAG